MGHLYVMLSKTDTRMGRFIRFCTKCEFNHVSLCIDDRLQSFVSFARYRQDVPLAGGAVTESLERLFSCGEILPVKLYKLEISQEELRKIESLFEELKDAHLVYNTPGALFNGCKIHYPVPGAYTCLEFAEAILGTKVKSIDRLGEKLEPWLYFQGDLFDLLQASGDRSDPYFQKRGFLKGSWDTINHFSTLFLRTLRLERPQDPIAGCHLDILPHRHLEIDAEKQLTFL